VSDAPTGQDSGAPRGLGGVTLGAAAVVVLLALGALLWPRAEVPDGAPALLVFDSSLETGRADGPYRRLCERLGVASGRDLQLVVATDMGAFRRHLAAAPAFLVVPDGVALAMDAQAYVPLVAGRRSAPMNLRPVGVLVHRLAAGDVAEPWRTRPERTVCGDSVSLAAVGALRQAGLTRWPGRLACGPDPYDHGPVLHALRLGGFDFALVRQWDAVRFFEAGLLSPARFGVRDLTEPVPDLLVLASRQLPRHVRLRCGESLAAVGRHPEHEGPADQELRRELAALRLVGFNPLLEPDFDAVRRKFPGHWLPAAD
jgi:hypothetical protein